MKKRLGYREMMAEIEELTGRYEGVSCSSIGRSLLGRELPMLTIGRGRSSYVYVGGVHAMEWHTSSVLLRFAFELGQWQQQDRFRYGMDPRFVLSGRRICIIPMLNPDGVELVHRGIGKDNVLGERLERMNPSGDFSHWQANARGVDLNHNFNAGFEEYRALAAGLGYAEPGPTRYPGEHPESEPEVQAICGFLRAIGGARLLLALHTQGEEIYWDYNGYAPGGQLRVARVLSRYCGYAVARPDGPASYSGLKDWALLEFGPLAYTVECGRGVNPLPPSDTPGIYARLARMLFRSLLI